MKWSHYINQKYLLCLLFCFLPHVSFAESILEKRANVLSQEVRCPVCLGQSIADSEMEASESLKAFILVRLNAGDSEEDIRVKLRSLYGDKILFRPPFERGTFLLWSAPFGFFLFGLVIILWKGYQSRAKKGT